MTENGNVVAPAAFSGRATRIDEQKINDLVDQGLLDKNVPALDSLDLPELAYAEVVIGNLSDDEALLYRNLFVATEQYESQQADLAANFYIGMGEAIRERAKQYDPRDKFTEEFFAKFFKLERKCEALRGLLFWYLSARLNCFDFKMSVRTKGRIVKGERKW